MFSWAFFLKASGSPDYLKTQAAMLAAFAMVTRGAECVWNAELFPHSTYVNVWRGLRCYITIRLARSRAWAVIIEQIQMFMDLTHIYGWCCHIYTPKSGFTANCSEAVATIMKYFLKDEGQKETLTFLPGEKRKTENPEQPPALHCRRERSVSLCVWERNRFWSHTHPPSFSLLPSFAASVV